MKRKNIGRSILVGKSTIKNKALDLLEQVVNPDTGRSLFAEKRVIDVQADNNSCHIILDKANLSASLVDVIKEQITRKMEDIYSKEKIGIEIQLRSSLESGQDSAQLQVGHERLQGKRQLNQVKKVIGIGSGKGGVGKSTVAANLALSLRREGKRVGIIDADIYGPSLPMIFGQRGGRPIASKDKKIIPIEAFGIHLMSFGFFVQEKDPVIWRGPMLGGVVNQFFI